MSGSSAAPAPAQPNNFQPQLLSNAIPSVSQGPYNVSGAWQNNSALRAAYPWIIPTSGDFAGANSGGGTGSGPNPNVPGSAGSPTALDPASIVAKLASGGKLNDLAAILAALAGPAKSVAPAATAFPGAAAPAPAYQPGSANLTPGTP